MKLLILFSTFLIISLQSFGQLDSTSVSLSVVDNYSYPGETDIHNGVLKMNLNFDDISDLDRMSIVVYIEPENVPITEQILIASDLVNLGLLQNNSLEYPIMDLEQGYVYRVEVNPQNTSGAFTRSCTASLAY